MRPRSKLVLSSGSGSLNESFFGEVFEVAAGGVEPAEVAPVDVALLLEFGATLVSEISFCWKFSFSVSPLQRVDLGLEVTC